MKNSNKDVFRIKNKLLLVNIIIVCFLVWLLAACHSSKNDNSNLDEITSQEIQTQEDDAIVESGSSTVCSSDDYGTSNGQINYKRAAIVAHDFVEEKMGKCDWSIYNITGEQLSDNQFKVMEKFTCKGDEYIYKIIIKYFGDNDDWTETKNWDYSQLTIEKVSTGEQAFYYGNLKDRERKKDSGKTIQVDGVVFTLLEKNLPNYVSFSHKGKLSRAQIYKAILKIKEQYNSQIIYLYRYPNSGAGEDYLCYQNGYVFDNEHNKAYNSLDDYKNNR